MTSFLDRIENSSLRADSFTITRMMERVSNLDAVMWGSSIVGCGLHHYVYESGRQGDTVIIGFSPRKQNIAVYLLGGISRFENELATLGKYKAGKGCLYIRSLGDVNQEVLEDVLVKAFKAGQTKG